MKIKFFLFVLIQILSMSSYSYECKSFFSKNWGLVLAENPKDQMGSDFRKLVDIFTKTYSPNTNSLSELAIIALNQRINLSALHNTQFASQMLSATGINHPFQERLNGRLLDFSWSFGVKNHPRADAIWKFMNDNLYPHNGTDYENDFVEIKLSPEVLPKTPFVKIWMFDYQTDNLILKFKTYQTADGDYYIQHAHGSDIPKIMVRLNYLWEQAKSAKTPELKLEGIAEFEWLWYWANPFGRGGASIGSMLSALLQNTLIESSSDFRPIEQFENTDLIALSLSLEEYILKKLRTSFPSHQ